MELINDELKKVIRHAFVLKYIQRSGVTMPKIPQIPNFEKPPVPDLNMLEEQIAKFQQASLNAGNNQSLYTDEYIQASNKYNELVKKAAEKYTAERNRIDESEKDVSKVTSEMRAKNSEKRTEIKSEYEESVLSAKKTSGLSSVKQKFKEIKKDDKKKAKEDAEKTNTAKLSNAKSESLEFLKQCVLKQYYDYIVKETEKLKTFASDVKRMYDDTVELFRHVQKKANDFYNTDSGKEFVDNECDKVNRAWDDICDSFTELGVDINAMVSKIPNPDVIVGGAATGVPNPSHKITIFMQDFKKVMKDITRIKNNIKTILSILTLLMVAIEQIPPLKEMIENMKKREDDADKNFKQAVKAARKKNKWYLEFDHPDEEGETKLAGFMYADLQVDYNTYDITLKGYKCYCKKTCRHTYKDENGIIQTSEWEGGYVKNGGDRVDASGRRYYYLTEEQICDNGTYTDEELNEIMDGDDLAAYNTEVPYDDVSGTTKLNLSDGRTVVVDYLASVGDTVKLDDGTVLKVVG